MDQAEFRCSWNLLPQYRSQHWPGGHEQQFGTHCVRILGVLVCTLVAVSVIYSLNSLTELIPLMSIYSAKLELSRMNTSKLQQCIKNVRSASPHGCQCLGHVVLTFPSTFDFSTANCHGGRRQPTPLHCYQSSWHIQAQREAPLPFHIQPQGKWRVKFWTTE